MLSDSMFLNLGIPQLWAKLLCKVVINSRSYQDTTSNHKAYIHDHLNNPRIFQN